MSMVTYPLNNIEYTAEDAELFHSTRTSGVYATNSFDYSVTGADNTIVIGTGIAWIKNSEFSGKVVAQKEPISLDMGLPDSVYPRIDAVVIQFDANKNSTEIVVKNGVAHSSPIAPEVVRTKSVYELHLYHVRREAGTLSIPASNITDLRSNNTYCGIMSDSITQAVDTTLSKSGIAAEAAAVGTALAKKAPAGYGLGENAKVITNPDDATAGGIYRIYDKTDNMPFNFMILLSMPYYNDLVQIGTQWTSGVMATRHHTSSTGWSEWGYITPPMVAGTEYRTTERWNGKVVYTKLIHCGTMPNNANVNIQGLTPNMNLIDFEVVFVSPYLSIKLPHFDNSGKMTARAICNTNSSVIQILTTTDMSQYTGYATIKYTKD